MTATTTMRSRYAVDAISTASPARLLIMLFDRLLRELTSAEQALHDGKAEAASASLLHAQAIVSELNTSLDKTVWDGAAGLSSLYVYVHEQLVRANIGKDVIAVVECRDLLQPLRDAWVQAALSAARPSAS